MIRHTIRSNPKKTNAKIISLAYVGPVGGHPMGKRKTGQPERKNVQYGQAHAPSETLKVTLAKKQLLMY